MTKCPRCGYQSSSLNINIYGGGSAGQRHARMLRERGHECRIYDPALTHECMHNLPTAVVIASPPETHEHYLKLWSGVCPILCEGPVTIPPLQSSGQHPCMTASNWVFVPQIQALKRKVEQQKVVSAHLWFDYDLARWRGPNWAYKDSCYYDSGIDLINCHEAMTALWLFGPAVEVAAYKQHTGKSNAADAMVVACHHHSGTLTTINSGWHAAHYQRGIRVVFRDGTVEEIGWTTPTDDAIVNQSYADMLDYWLKAIAENDCEVRPSLLDGYRAYKLMQGEVA